MPDTALVEEYEGRKHKIALVVSLAIAILTIVASKAFPEASWIIPSGIGILIVFGIIAFPEVRDWIIRIRDWIIRMRNKLLNAK